MSALICRWLKGPGWEQGLPGSVIAGGWCHPAGHSSGGPYILLQDCALAGGGPQTWR